VIFKRKMAEIITEIFGAKFGVKFSENFSVKRKQLDRMVSIIIRGAQDRQVCAYRKRKTDDRGRGEMIQSTHSLNFPEGCMWSMFKVINQPFVLELNSNAGRMLLLSRTSLLNDIYIK